MGLGEAREWEWNVHVMHPLVGDLDEWVWSRGQYYVDPKRYLGYVTLVQDFES